MAKIAILSNREREGSLFTKKDTLLWSRVQKEVCLELEKPYWKKHELLIPIYTKFDRMVLYHAIRHKLAVTLYLPSEDWGSQFLPQNQIYYISTAKSIYPMKVYAGSQERLEAMSEDCDAVYALRTSSNFEFSESRLVGKIEHRLDISRLAEELKQEEETTAYMKI